MPPSFARQQENASKPTPPPPSPLPINTNHSRDLLREETREKKGPAWHFVPAEGLFTKTWFMSQVTTHPRGDFSAVLPSPVWARFCFTGPETQVGMESRCLGSVWWTENAVWSDFGSDFFEQLLKRSPDVREHCCHLRALWCSSWKELGSKRNQHLWPKISQHIWQPHWNLQQRGLFSVLQVTIGAENVGLWGCFFPWCSQFRLPNSFAHIPDQQSLWEQAEPQCWDFSD